MGLEEAASPAYRHALEQQRSRPDLPYGLEVWRGDKVLSVLNGHPPFNDPYKQTSPGIPHLMTDLTLKYAR